MRQLSSSFKYNVETQLQPIAAISISRKDNAQQPPTEISSQSVNQLICENSSQASAEYLASSSSDGSAAEDLVFVCLSLAVFSVFFSLSSSIQRSVQGEQQQQKVLGSILSNFAFCFISSLLVFRSRVSQLALRFFFLRHYVG